MKRLTRCSKKYVFLIVFFAVFLTTDGVIARYAPNYMIESGKFWLNDFELTQRDHPEEIWDKVFFGNSAVYAAYRQEESKSGYVNLGMDYAVLTDLWKMLRKGDVKIGSDLALGLNWLSLYDDFETNPNYIWHRGALEPYCYFQRDRLSKILTDKVKQLTLGISETADYTDQEKTRYSSSLSDEALAEKTEDFSSRFFNAPPDAFQKNIAAMKNIIEYCDENGIRIRIVFMPWNPKIEMPVLVSEILESVNAICGDCGVEVYDMMNSMDAECFADIAHLNAEYGAHKFTEEIDRWLCL